MAPAPAAPATPAPAPSLDRAAERAVARARSRGGPVLLAWTARAPPRDPLGFLAQGEPPRWYFASPGGASLAALGEAAALEAAGAKRFDDLRLQAAALLGHAEVAGDGTAGAPGPCFVGGFAFADHHEPAGAWEGFPAARFAAPSAVLRREGEACWATVQRLVEGREDPRALARNVAGAAERASMPYPEAPGPAGQPLPAFGRHHLERAEWLAGVERALQAVRRGRLDKVVLARRVPVPLTAPLAGPAALARLAARYPDCYRFLAEPRAGRAFLGASPELLARRRGGALETWAVAGSAPRGRDPEEDARRGRELLASAKERREHDLVVGHLRERLQALGAPPAEGPGEPRLLRLRNVQHLATPLHARAPAEGHVLDLAAALHPTPAVAGAPPEAALRFLGEHEAFDRGWYAGAVGWFDARGDGELAVALRCALLEGAEAWLFAGAGIVADSVPAREWDETALKLDPMLEALGCP